MRFIMCVFRNFTIRICISNGWIWSYLQLLWKRWKIEVQVVKRSFPSVIIIRYCWGYLSLHAFDYYKHVIKSSLSFILILWKISSNWWPLNIHRVMEIDLSTGIFYTLCMKLDWCNYWQICQTMLKQYV